MIDSPHTENVESNTNYINASFIDVSIFISFLKLK